MPKFCYKKLTNFYTLIEKLDLLLNPFIHLFHSYIQGGKESNLPLGSIYVRQVYSDGAAWKSKRIKEGDRLLAVNGISLENILHAEVSLVINRKIIQCNVYLNHLSRTHIS